MGRAASARDRHVMDCYQCAGFWCGIAMGLMLLSNKPFVVFAAGCAGSFLANSAGSCSTP